MHVFWTSKSTQSIIIPLFITLGRFAPEKYHDISREINLHISLIITQQMYTMYGFDTFNKLYEKFAFLSKCHLDFVDTIYIHFHYNRFRRKVLPLILFYKKKIKDLHLYITLNINIYIIVIFLTSIAVFLITEIITLNNKSYQVKFKQLRIGPREQIDHAPLYSHKNILKVKI